MPRVIHFEILADDPERAVRFCEKVFGLKIKKWEGPADCWLVTTGEDSQPGINGAIVERTDHGTTYNTIDVISVDEFIQKIVKAGGKAVSKKTTVLGVGYMAYCADTRETHSESCRQIHQLTNHGRQITKPDASSTCNVL